MIKGFEGAGPAAERMLVSGKAAGQNISMTPMHYAIVKAIMEKNGLRKKAQAVQHALEYWAEEYAPSLLDIKTE